MTKDKNMKCGFCDKEIKDPKELGTINTGEDLLKLVHSAIQS